MPAAKLKNIRAREHPIRVFQERIQQSALSARQYNVCAVRRGEAPVDDIENETFKAKQWSRR